MANEKCQMENGKSSPFPNLRISVTLSVVAKALAHRHGGQGKMVAKPSVTFSKLEYPPTGLDNRAEKQWLATLGNLG